MWVWGSKGDVSNVGIVGNSSVDNSQTCAVMCRVSRCGIMF